MLHRVSKHQNIFVMKKEFFMFCLKCRTWITQVWCTVETKLYLPPQYNNGFGNSWYIKMPLAHYKLCMSLWFANVELRMANLLVKPKTETSLFMSPSDVCIGLRLQQVMKSQWQTKSLERSKPLKKLSLKHKLSSSKEKHKFTNSLMAVSKYKCNRATDYKYDTNRIHCQRIV